MKAKTKRTIGYGILTLTVSVLLVAAYLDGGWRMIAALTGVFGFAATLVGSVVLIISQDEN